MCLHRQEILYCKSAVLNGYFSPDVARAPSRLQKQLFLSCEPLIYSSYIHAGCLFFKRFITAWSEKAWRTLPIC